MILFAIPIWSPSVSMVVYLNGGDPKIDPKIL